MDWQNWGTTMTDAAREWREPLAMIPTNCSPLHIGLLRYSWVTSDSWQWKASLNLPRWSFTVAA